MRRNESELQIACINYFRYVFPQHKLLLFAIPNGGKRNMLTALRMKREGVVAGVPDLFLSLPRGGWHGMYIEIKFGKNKLTQRQEDFFAAASKHNYKCVAVYTLDEFTREVTNYIQANL